MYLAALFYVVPSLVFHLDCSALSLQISCYGLLEEKLCTAIQMGVACRRLQILSGSSVAGFGLPFPIFFLDFYFVLLLSVYLLEGSIFK